MPIAAMRLRQNAGAPPATYSGYSPTNRGGQSTLDAGNFELVAAGGGVNRWALSNVSKASGKFHVQVRHVTQSDTMGSGIAMSTSVASYMGENANSAGLFSNYGSNSQLFFNGAGTSYAVSYANGDAQDVWVDISSGLAWWGKNGTPISGSPSAGTGAMRTFTPGTIWIISDTTGPGGRTRFLIPSEMSGGVIAGFTEGWPD